MSHFFKPFVLPTLLFVIAGPPIGGLIFCVVLSIFTQQPAFLITISPLFIIFSYLYGAIPAAFCGVIAVIMKKRLESNLNLFLFSVVSVFVTMAFQLLTTQLFSGASASLSSMRFSSIIAFAWPAFFSSLLLGWIYVHKAT